MQRVQIGIPEGVKNAYRIEAHTLRLGESHWELFIGRYSMAPAVGATGYVINIAGSLHKESLYNVRVVVHSAINGEKVSTILSGPRDDWSKPHRTIPFTTMEATDADRKPKEKVH